MTLPALMADSVTPTAIPSKFARKPNGVAGYYDGLYAWHQHQFRMWPRVWRITVTGAAAAAPHCRVVDVETGDATPGVVDDYQHDRLEADQRETIVYCDRSTVPEVIKASPMWPELFWWIATLDGNVWSQQLMSQWLQENYGVLVDPDRIRAIQNVGARAYDCSLLFGNPHWEAG